MVNLEQLNQWSPQEAQEAVKMLWQSAMGRRHDLFRPFESQEQLLLRQTVFGLLCLKVNGSPRLAITLALVKHNTRQIESTADWSAGEQAGVAQRRRRDSGLAQGNDAYYEKFGLSFNCATGNRPRNVERIRSTLPNDRATELKMPHKNTVRLPRYDWRNFNGTTVHPYFKYDSYRPAANVSITLDKQDGGDWILSRHTAPTMMVVWVLFYRRALLYLKA